MATGIMFLVMFGLMFLGVPIAVAMFISMFVLIHIDPVTTSSFIAQTTYGGVASFTNLALPFFMISGTIMETGGLSRRLVNAANSIIGGVTGSLGMVTVIACMFFGAVSGSAPATVAAIGAIMIPMMVQEGYNKYYATALACCAGGPAIPWFCMALPVTSPWGTCSLRAFCRLVWWVESLFLSITDTVKSIS